MRSVAKFILFILVLIAVFSGCACTGESNTETPADQDSQPQAKPKTVTVATWNVHNFFNTTCDSGACGSSDYEKVATESSYRSNLARIVKGIQQLNADVILLQEMETEECLSDIQSTIGKNNYASYVFGEIGRTASLDVGILTKGEITNVYKHRANHVLEQTDGSLKQLSRELLEVEIRLPNGIELTAFTTHFVSKATDEIGDRRLKEAVLTQSIIAEYVAAHPERFVVFGGDLNDTPESEQIQAIGKDGILLSVTRDMAASAITTWKDSVAFDHIFYDSSHSSTYEKTEIVCDSVRSAGFSGSDHCSVKASFNFNESTQD